MSIDTTWVDDDWRPTAEQPTTETAPAPSPAPPPAPADGPPERQHIFEILWQHFYNCQDALADALYFRQLHAETGRARRDLEDARAALTYAGKYLS